MRAPKPTTNCICNVFVYFLLFLLLILANPVQGQQLAFPTASGAGAYATGGRGLAVFKVTSLADSGAGTFRQACEDVQSNGGGNIVFEVSGTIILNSTLYAFLDNTTISGQTAPQGGITIGGTGDFVLESFDNSIMRYMRFRQQVSGDLVGFYRTSNFIIDHCSFAGGGDEGLDTTYQTDTFTLQNNLIIACKTGVITGDSDNINYTTSVSFNKNIFYNTSHRFPNLSVDGRADVINNLMWNYTARMSVIQGEIELNHVNNYYLNKYGELDDPNRNNPELYTLGRRGMLYAWDDGGAGTVITPPQFYTAGNILTETITDPNADNWQYWHWRFAPPASSGYSGTTEGPLPTDFQSNTMFPLIGGQFNVRTAEEIKTQLPNEVGANARLDSNGNIISDIDSVDQIAIDNITSDTVVYYNQGNLTDEYTQYIRDFWATFSTVPLATRTDDTNGDGIPEAWASNNMPIGASYSDIADPQVGYTYLELYLNEIDGTYVPVNIPQITRTDTNPTTIEVGGAYVPPTGTWTDVEDGSGEATVGGDTVDVNTIGTYNVILEYTDTDGNTGSLTIPVNIIAEVVNATGILVSPAEVTLAEDSDVQLNVTFTPSTTTDQTGVWTSSNGNATVDANGLVTVISAGTSIITFTSNDGNFTDISTITINPSILPTAIEFEFPAPSYSYWAEFDEGTINPTATLVTIDPDVNATHTYSIPTPNVDDYQLFSIVNGDQLRLNITPDYENPVDTVGNNKYALNVRVTNSNGGVFDQFMLFDILDVNEEILSANAGEDQSICEGQTTTLTATGGPNYLWDTGETTATIEVTPSQTTTYTVIVSNNNGDEDTDSLTVNVDTPPNLTISDNITILEGDSTTLTASGANDYLWSSGETTSSITVNPTQTTTYTVTGANGGCEVQAQVTVTVEDIFEASAGADERVCDSGSYEVELTANDGDSYLWSTGETTQSIIVSPLSTTTYSVTITLGTQEDSDDVTVYVDPTPNVNISNGASVDILEGDFITLSASGANSYQWSNGATQPNIAVSPSATTTYEVTGYIGDCFDEKQITVNVFEPVVADAGDDVFICIDETATLTATGGDEYVWSTGEITQTIQVSPMQTTDYTVTVFNALDYDEATVRVEVDANCDEEPIEPEDDSLEFSFDIYPNPASDVVNIRLNGSLQVSQIYVFDLTGKIIQQTAITNENQDLSTTTQIDIRSLQPGVYFVKLVDEDIDITKKLIVN